MGGWVDGWMGRWGDGEVGRWGDGVFLDFGFWIEAVGWMGGWVVDVERLPAGQGGWVVDAERLPGGLGRF